MEIRKSKPYAIAADEKAVPMMLYTPTTMVHGEVVMKASVRASIWMRTQSAPEFMHLLKAQVIPVGPTGPGRPFSYPELLFATHTMLAYHIAPPGQAEGYDYDESEKNRAFEAVSVVVGMFTMNGVLRIGATSDIPSAVISGRQTWASIYDAEISSPVLPQMGKLKVPLVLVRASEVQYGMNNF